MILYQLVKRLSQRQSSAWIELSWETEVKCDETEEGIKGKCEIKVCPYGMMQRAKLRDKLTSGATRGSRLLDIKSQKFIKSFGIKLLMLRMILP